MTKVYSEKDVCGTTRWYKEDTHTFHREDGPAIEFYNGNKFWFQNGKYHRIGGSAVELHDGTKLWYQNGLCHRTDGPAVEYENGGKEYWLNGRYYSNIKTDEEWIIFQIIN